MDRSQPCLFYAFCDDERRPPTARDEEQSQCNGRNVCQCQTDDNVQFAQQFQIFLGAAESYGPKTLALPAVWLSYLTQSSYSHSPDGDTNARTATDVWCHCSQASVLELHVRIAIS